MARTLMHQWLAHNLAYRALLLFWLTGAARIPANHVIVCDRAPRPDMTHTLDTPFWTFSLAVYAQDGVAAECLELQERLRVDVNLLLFAAYAGAVEGAQMRTADIAAAAGHVALWHDEIVRTLRQVRRSLKPITLDTNNPFRGQSADLRKRVQAAELEAEKIEQGMLWRWWQQRLATGGVGDRKKSTEENLRALLAFYRAPPARSEPKDALPRLLDASNAYAGSTR
jgi:uncharacterized protein (TIGR02444 family)